MMNFYKIGAGTDLDALVHQRIFEPVNGSAPPPYSIDSASADKVKARLVSRYGSIVCGNTRIQHQSWFARFGSDPSTSLEVIAPTYPLAICRLALLLADRDL